MTAVTSQAVLLTIPRDRQRRNVTDKMTYVCVAMFFLFKCSSKMQQSNSFQFVKVPLNIWRE
jgi:hypothetical protein